eukprot:scaffold59087_cov26-Tisochrysis_lutea.AAC.4
MTSCTDSHEYEPSLPPGLSETTGPGIFDSLMVGAYDGMGVKPCCCGCSSPNEKSMPACPPSSCMKEAARSSSSKSPAETSSPCSPNCPPESTISASESSIESSTSNGSARPATGAPPRSHEEKDSVLGNTGGIIGEMRFPKATPPARSAPSLPLAGAASDSLGVPLPPSSSPPFPRAVAPRPRCCLCAAARGEGRGGRGERVWGWGREERAMPPEREERERRA